MGVEIEKMRSSKKIYEGKMIHVSLDEVEVNGDITEREWVKHPGAAAVLAITEEKEILFVRQYRYAVGKVLLEIPAGKRDSGETPESCALRELEEETGYRGTLLKLGSIYTTPGFCDETIHLYLAENLVSGTPHLDDHEYLDVVKIPVEEVFSLIEEGKIEDAKTLSALLLATPYLKV